MPASTAQVTTTGTPVTSRLGVGAVAGNAVTIGGLTLAPNQPGWRLISSTGGPGFVTGAWQYGVQSDAKALPAQGAYYRSGTGGASGGGNDEGYEIYTPLQARPSKIGWILLGLVATLLLKGK